MMRPIGLAGLAIAAVAALWYTSTHGLPYYYDAMIFVLAITGAALLVDTSSNSRSKRPRRIIREGAGKHAPIVYDSHQLSVRSAPGNGTLKSFPLTGSSRATPVQERPARDSINS
jgi:hypothetical protein